MSAPDTNKPSKTNWAQVDKLTDGEIDTSDIPLLPESFFDSATLRMPQEPVVITVHLDPDVVAWFNAQGDEYEQRINAALRIYVEAHKAYGR